jgi:hypothetical protein
MILLRNDDIEVLDDDMILDNEDFDDLQVLM